MQNFIFFYYMIALAFSLPGLLLAFFFYARERKPFFLGFASALGGLFILLALLVASYYANAMVYFPPPPFQIPRSPAAYWLDALLYLVGFLALKRTSGVVKTRYILVMVAAVLILFLVGIQAGLTDLTDPGPGYDTYTMGRRISHVVSTLFLFFMAFTLFRCAKIETDPSRTLFFRYLFRVFLFYAALTIPFFLLPFGSLNFVLTPVLLFLWSGSIVLAYFKRHVRDSGGSELVMSVDSSAFSLTPRERQMITLILQGQSNKAIAGDLDISLATVKTHIYNLYQKMGVRSRMEMLNALARKNAPTRTKV